MSNAPTQTQLRRCAGRRSQRSPLFLSQLMRMSPSRTILALTLTLLYVIVLVTSTTVIASTGIDSPGKDNNDVMSTSSSSSYNYNYHGIAPRNNPSSSTPPSLSSATTTTNTNSNNSNTHDEHDEHDGADDDDDGHAHSQLGNIFAGIVVILVITLLCCAICGACGCNTWSMCCCFCCYERCCASCSSPTRRRGARRRRGGRADVSRTAIAIVGGGGAAVAAGAVDAAAAAPAPAAAHPRGNLREHDTDDDADDELDYENREYRQEAPIAACCSSLAYIALFVCMSPRGLNVRQCMKRFHMSTQFVDDMFGAHMFEQPQCNVLEPGMRERVQMRAAQRRRARRHSLFVPVDVDGAAGVVAAAGAVDGDGNAAVLANVDQAPIGVAVGMNPAVPALDVQVVGDVAAPPAVQAHPLDGGGGGRRGGAAPPHALAIVIDVPPVAVAEAAGAAGADPPPPPLQGAPAEPLHTPPASLTAQPSFSSTTWSRSTSLTCLVHDVEPSVIGGGGGAGGAPMDPVAQIDPIDPIAPIAPIAHAPARIAHAPAHAPAPHLLADLQLALHP